jgi:hypothetical protein
MKLSDGVLPFVVLEAWKAQRRAEQEEALKIKRNITGYAYDFRSEEHPAEMRSRDPGVSCDHTSADGTALRWTEEVRNALEIVS